MTPTVILLLFLCSVVEFTLTLEECSELPSVEHAFVLDEYKRAQYHKGDVIYFCCDPGYTTGLNTTYICTERGWRAAIFSTCVDICSELPVVANAQIQDQKDMYQRGDVVRYFCDLGYTSEDQIRYVCSDDGWSRVHAGVCTLKPCAPPDNITNGYYEIITGEDFVFGTTIKYFCDEGYEMVNREDTRTCSFSGWSNSSPVCENCFPRRHPFERTGQSAGREKRHFKDVTVQTRLHVYHLELQRRKGPDAHLDARSPGSEHERSVHGPGEHQHGRTPDAHRAQDRGQRRVQHQHRVHDRRHGHRRDRAASHRFSRIIGSRVKLLLPLLHQTPSRKAHEVSSQGGALVPTAGVYHHHG